MSDLEKRFNWLMEEGPFDFTGTGTNSEHAQQQERQYFDRFNSLKETCVKQEKILEGLEQSQAENERLWSFVIDFGLTDLESISQVDALNNKAQELLKEKRNEK